MRLGVFLGCFLFCPFSIAASFDDLVERDGVYYQKSSQVPYTGQIDGIEKGLIRNGKKEGAVDRLFSVTGVPSVRHTSKMVSSMVSSSHIRVMVMLGAIGNYRRWQTLRGLGNLSIWRRSLADAIRNLHKRLQSR